MSARTRPLLLRHHASVDEHGAVLVDGLPGESQQWPRRSNRLPEPALTSSARQSPSGFDILPLLVATDGAIQAFGHDARRLRPNVVLVGDFRRPVDLCAGRPISDLR